MDIAVHFAGDLLLVSEPTSLGVVRGSIAPVSPLVFFWCINLADPYFRHARIYNFLIFPLACFMGFYDGGRCFLPVVPAVCLTRPRLFCRAVCPVFTVIPSLCICSIPSCILSVLCLTRVCVYNLAAA